MCLPLLLALAQLVQDPVPRQGQRLNTTTPRAQGPALATSGASDLTAVLYHEQEGGGNWQGGYVVTSDGRGVDWNVPVRVDNFFSCPFGLATCFTGLTGTYFETRNIAIVGDHVYVAWRDARTFESDVYFDRSLNRGATFGFDVRLDKGSPSGMGVAPTFWTLAASPGAAGNHVYVMLHVRAGPSSSQPHDVFLVSSHDSGASFGAAVPVSTRNFSGVNHERIGMVAEGLAVHCIWLDDRNDPVTNTSDVFYRRSVDGGATFGPELQLDDSPPGAGDARFNVAVAAAGSIVAVSWLEDDRTAPGSQELRLAVSNDGGASFAASQRLGAYDPTAVDVHTQGVSVCGGNVVAAWADDRTGAFWDVYSVTSTDGGATFGPEVRHSFDAGLFPSFGQEGSGTGPLGLTWQDPLDPTPIAEASHSRDCGVSWAATGFQVSTNDHITEPLVAFNGRYHNFVHVYESYEAGPQGVYGGGYRPPTVRPVGFVSGGTARFDLSGWEPGSPGFAWVLGANDPGTLLLPFGDGRNLGLSPDGTFLVTLSNPATFLTTLDATGTGATPQFPLAVPPGSVLYAAAVSFTPGPVVLAELSDAIRIDVP